jgi:hypothetical protein
MRPCSVVRASRSTDSAAAGALPCIAPTLPCYRERRGGDGDDGGIEPVCTDVPDGAPPPRGTQRRTRHRRMTTVSSTSSFRRRCVDAIAAAPAEHASTQRHRSVLLHARARARHPSLGAAVRAPTGPAWSPSSSPPQRERVKARGERSAPVDGKWKECCEQICRPRAPHASVGRSAGMSWQD